MLINRDLLKPKRNDKKQALKYGPSTLGRPLNDDEILLTVYGPKNKKAIWQLVQRSSD